MKRRGGEDKDLRTILILFGPEQPAQVFVTSEFAGLYLFGHSLDPAAILLNPKAVKTNQYSY